MDVPRKINIKALLTADDAQALLFGFAYLRFTGTIDRTWILQNKSLKTELKTVDVPEYQSELEALFDKVISADEQLTTSQRNDLFSQLIDMPIVHIIGLARSLNSRFSSDNYLRSTYSLEKLMLSLADIQPDDSVLDPTFSRSELIFRLMLHNRTQSITAEAINDEIVAMGYIASLILGATNTHLYTGEVLDDPQYFNGDYLQKFDKVVTVPPVGARMEYTDNVMDDKYNRFPFGVPSRKSADWAFVSNAVSSLNADPQSKAVVVVQDGALFRSGRDAIIRQNMIDYDLIESVISLPNGSIGTTTAPVSVLVLGMNKSDEMKNKIQFIKVEKSGLNKKEIEFSDDEIKQITKWYRNKEDIEGISRIVSKNQINKSELLVNKYVYSPYFNVDGQSIQFHHDKLEAMKTIPLSQIAEIGRGFNLTTKDENRDGKYKIIKISDLKDEISYDRLSHFNLSGNADIERYLIRRNDIIMSIRGTISKMRLIEDDVSYIAINSNMVRLRVKSQNYDPQWLSLYLNSPLIKILLNKSSVGSTIAQIPVRDLENLPVPVLDIEEQLKMATNYMRENDKVEQIIAQMRDVQQTLKKNLYDQMNITDAVELL
ncbi:N-6 DNA methylase [Companilactobacillus hulinensis]|uniref:N-6 DNA methylase n=1 Tax=Companilactobacillus hulinensis TaxID=2486007 RepID=UPI000F796AC3|nr:N-6 DNA methylase [Companilactobacillus hulinensis]